jgi:hypothetical protein
LEFVQTVPLVDATQSRLTIIAKRAIGQGLARVRYGS